MIFVSKRDLTICFFKLYLFESRREVSTAVFGRNASFGTELIQVSIGLKWHCYLLLSLLFCSSFVWRQVSGLLLGSLQLNISLIYVYSSHNLHNSPDCYEHSCMLTFPWYVLVLRPSPALAYYLKINGIEEQFRSTAY